MFIGPILAAGLCELSRRSERGESVSFDDSLKGLNRSQASLTQLASILLGLSVVWLFVSSLVLFATVGNVVPTLEQALWGNFFDSLTPLQIMLYTVIGGLLAVVVFFLSVVSVPAILDSFVTAQQAIATSIEVVIENPVTMLVWASLIVALSVIGFATFLIGMVVIYPLLGHATWHAYRDLVEDKSF